MTQLELSFLKSKNFFPMNKISSLHGFWRSYTPKNVGRSRSKILVIDYHILPMKH
jgi:hypothetical protein